MKLREWIKHFLVYGLGVVLMNVLPALMIPIYTYRVSPSTYGILELLNRSQDILILILSFGLRSSLVTFYQMSSDEPERQRLVYATALQFLFAFGFTLILLLLFGAGTWSSLLFGTRAYWGAVLLILIGAYFETTFQIAVLYLQSQLRSVLYVSIFTTRALLALVLNLIFVYWLRWGLMGILWATLLHTAGYAVGVAIYVFRHTGFRFDRQLLREMLRFGAPVMFGAFASFLLNNGDRYFLNHYGTAADVGLYGLGYRVGVLSMSLILMPFLKIWSVTMVDISKRPDGPVELGQVATYLLCASTFSTLGFALLGPYLIRFFSERSYWDAYRVVPLVGAAYIFYSWTIVMDASFYVTKRTFYKMHSIFIAGGIVLVLYWLLIPRFGMMGAAWATLGGYVSYAAFDAFYAQRVYRIHYQLKRIALLFAAGVLLYELGNLVPVTPIIAGMIIRSAVILTFPIILWLSGFVTPGERRRVAQHWRTLRSRYFGGSDKLNEAAVTRVPH